MSPVRPNSWSTTRLSASVTHVPFLPAIIICYLLPIEFDVLLVEFEGQISNGTCNFYLFIPFAFIYVRRPPEGVRRFSGGTPGGTSMRRLAARAGV
jgi:hypothetical protein